MFAAAKGIARQKIEYFSSFYYLDFSQFVLGF